MRTTIITALVAGVVTLAGCGGGSSGVRPDSAGGTVQPPPTPPPVSNVPIPHPERATQAPMVLDAMIGLPYLNPPNSVLTTVARHTTPASHTGWSPVSTGVAADGTPRAELIRYLSADIAASGGTLNRFASPPVIHFAAGATDQDIDATVQAVQMINAALPDAWQLMIGATAKAAGIHEAAAGEILMVFDRSAWPAGCVHGLACSDVRVNAEGDIASASIFADPGRQTDPMYAVWIAHELLHALGREHADPQQFPQSVMVPQENLSRAADILDILDRDALLAVYGMLEAGDTSAELYQKLGAWEHESFHVMGGFLFGEEDNSLWFGVADRNAEQSAWVLGKTSPMALADNPQLSGSARWEGRVLGMTPSARIVAGAAELGIDLSTLTGELAFTGLEQWAPRANPGDIGTGTRWGDGDLRYGVQVRGSTFVQTSGDAGVVTGKFIGPVHDAMGGILDRDDLDAAFGGTR